MADDFSGEKFAFREASENRLSQIFANRYEGFYESGNNLSNKGINQMSTTEKFQFEVNNTMLYWIHYKRTLYIFVLGIFHLILMKETYVTDFFHSPTFRDFKVAVFTFFTCFKHTNIITDLNFFPFCLYFSAKLTTLCKIHLTEIY